MSKKTNDFWHTKGRCWRRLYNELGGLKDILANWNGQGSEPPNEKALANAKAVLDGAAVLDEIPDRVVADADDGVGIYFLDCSHYVSIACDNEGGITGGYSDRKGTVDTMDLGPVDGPEFNNKLAALLGRLTETQR